jgi:alpha-ketoglutarate-dependent taurine dioxygenase
MSETEEINMKNILDELTGYRVKVKKDGKEIVNVPGILALPGLLIAPKVSIIGMVAAPLLGCSIHLENENGKDVDIGKAVKETADTVVDKAATAAETVREQFEKAWNDLSADDPEGCPEGQEKEDDTSEQENPEDDIPVIHVKPDDSEKE